MPACDEAVTPDFLCCCVLYSWLLRRSLLSRTAVQQKTTTLTSAFVEIQTHMRLFICLVERASSLYVRTTCLCSGGDAQLDFTILAISPRSARMARIDLKRSYL